MKCSDSRLLHPVIQQKLRQTAVELFLRGENPTDVSKELGVSRQSVYNWIKKHSESGTSGLEIHKRSRPKGTQLQPWQSAQIVKIIKILAQMNCQCLFSYGLVKLLGF